MSFSYLTFFDNNLPKLSNNYDDLELFIYSFIWHFLCKICKPQNQICDLTYNWFIYFMPKSYFKLFYMNHTFEFDVSLHSWLLWPMVGRGGNRATKFLAELISSLKYKTS